MTVKLFRANLIAKFIKLLKMKTSVIRKCVVEPKCPDNGGSTVIANCTLVPFYVPHSM